MVGQPEVDGDDRKSRVLRGARRGAAGRICGTAQAPGQQGGGGAAVRPRRRCRRARPRRSSSKLKLPPGFSIALYADNVPGARSMALGSDGTVFVGTPRADVYAVVDRNRDYKADEVLTVASGLTSAQRRGVQGRRAVRGRDQPDLAVRRRARLREGAGGAPGAQATVLTDKLPTDRQHGWKYLAFGPDGLLYTRSARRATSSIAAIRTRRSSA